MKTKIAVEWIEYLNSELSKINKMDMKDIIWMENGVIIDTSEKVLDAFRFTGLSNKSFVDVRFWEDYEYLNSLEADEK